MKFNIYFKVIILALVFVGCNSENAKQEEEEFSIKINIWNEEFQKEVIFSSVGRIFIYSKNKWNSTSIDRKFTKDSKISILLNDSNKQTQFSPVFFTVLGFTHNIKEENIIDNSISIKTDDRLLKERNIQFNITKNIEMNFLVMDGITDGLITLCSKSGKDDIKLFGLNSNLEKKELYPTNYSKEVLYSGVKLDVFFKIEDIEEEYLLVECYEYGMVKYSGLFHLTKNEYWNFWRSKDYYLGTLDKNIKLPKFRISYLTELYYRGFRVYRNNNVSIQNSKIKVNKIIKILFPNYPFEELGFHSSSYIENELIENYLDNLEKKFQDIEKKYNISSSYILNLLEEYLFIENSNNSMTFDLLIEYLINR